MHPLISRPEGTALAAGITRQVVADIRRGRLRPGERLPGSRPLATSLGVHRNTVLAALRELEAEGWIRTEPGRGTFVVDTLPEADPLPFAPASSQAVITPYPLPEPPPDVLGPTIPPQALPLLGGMPDLRHTPGDALARAWRRALRQGPRVLGYGDPRGVPALREALAVHLRALRGLAIDADDLLITRGAQQALYLTARALLRPGDRVAVEALGYRPAWEALRASGAELCPVGVDADGLVVDEVIEAHRHHPLRAVYLTPHHQYPTTVPLTATRRITLLRWAAEHGVALIEDDYDHEFHYDSRPILPLASADPAGVVIHIGTLSKVFAPGLRLGYLSASPPLLHAATRWRALIDRQGDPIGETAVAELLGDGELHRHVGRMRRIYARRRAALVEALRENLSDLMHFDIPAGGMALWARLPEGTDTQAWAQRAADRGVWVQTAARFDFSGRNLPAMRLGFAALEEEKLREAVQRLRATWQPA